MVILAFLFWLFLFHPQVKESENVTAIKVTNSVLPEKKPANCEDCVRRKIDGVYVDPATANLEPTAIMIDNHPDARPQYGIEKANLVYEAEVEGYYTRLMAVFASGEKVDKIGPVRSARPYFVDWAQELGAVYAHCGGSPEALVDIEQKGLADLNEFYNGQYFWRTTDHVAPHNIYTSTENFSKFVAAKNVAASDYSAWQYKDDTPVNNSSSTAEIPINFQVPEFRSKWVYDKTDNDYIRYFEDKPELTAGNDLITAKNVIIQTVSSTVIDAELRLKMQDVGSGEATFCLDGVCRTGRWDKQDYSSRTRFTYADGNEVKFNAGTTWIEVMRPR
jgi:hypothetical protein